MELPFKMLKSGPGHFKKHCHFECSGVSTLKFYVTFHDFGIVTNSDVKKVCRVQVLLLAFIQQLGRDPDLKCIMVFPDPARHRSKVKIEFLSSKPLAFYLCVVFQPRKEHTLFFFYCP